MVKLRKEIYSYLNDHIHFFCLQEFVDMYVESIAGSIC